MPPFEYEERDEEVTETPEEHEECGHAFHDGGTDDTEAEGMTDDADDGDGIVMDMVVRLEPVINMLELAFGDPYDGEPGSSGSNSRTGSTCPKCGKSAAAGSGQPSKDATSRPKTATVPVASLTEQMRAPRNRQDAWW